MWMDNGTGFERISDTEEDGRSSINNSLGLGFDMVHNCGTGIWRI